jgi:hypothetical protein
MWHSSRRKGVYGELSFRQATRHATLLHPFLYVIDFKRALNFREAQALSWRMPQPSMGCQVFPHRFQVSYTFVPRLL